VGIKEWFRRHQIDPVPDPARYDEALQEDRTEAAASRESGQQQVAEVRKLQPKSDTVHRGMKQLREDNHFGPWLLRSLTPKEGR
jgi:hypothetical protein